MLAPCPPPISESSTPHCSSVQLKGSAVGAEAAVAALRAHHEAAWLPHWAEERAAAAAAAAGPALASARASVAAAGADARKRALEAWEAHASPALGSTLATLRARAGDAAAAAGRLGSEHLPRAQAAAAAGLATAKRLALEAWHSDAVASVRPALAAAGRGAAKLYAQVVAETEGALLTLLRQYPGAKPFARYAPHLTHLLLSELLSWLLFPGWWGLLVAAGLGSGCKSPSISSGRSGSHRGRGAAAAGLAPGAGARAGDALQERRQRQQQVLQEGYQEEGAWLKWSSRGAAAAASSAGRLELLSGTARGAEGLWELTAPSAALQD